MAEINHGIINYLGVVRKAVFDRSFELITNVDIAGKKLIFQVRRNPNDTLILDFSEVDNSLQVANVSDIEGTDKTSRTITLHKAANEMSILPSFYKSGLWAYSDQTDGILLATGFFEVVDKIPQTPTL